MTHAVDSGEAVSGPGCARNSRGVVLAVTSGSAIAAVMVPVQGQPRLPVTSGGLGTGQQEFRRSCLSLEIGQVLALVKVKRYLDKKCSACACDVSDFTSGDNDKTRKGRLPSALIPLMR